MVKSNFDVQKMMNRIIITFAFLFACIFAHAQDSLYVTLTGRVIDNYDRPVAGASMIVKGTMQATATDENGNFELKYTGVNKAITLIISVIGGFPYGEKQINLTASKIEVGDVVIENRALTGILCCSCIQKGNPLKNFWLRTTSMIRR